jgi:magnesium transporter
MRSAFQAPVPSSTLLRFLKSQSESICFFSPNPRPGFIFDHAAPRGIPGRPGLVKSPSKSSARCLSTTALRKATHEANFLNLELLWPHSAASTINTQSAHSRGLARRRKFECGRTLITQRSSSSGSKKWHQKLWGVTSAKGGKPLRPDDLPSTLFGSEEGSDTYMFSLGRHISAKAAAQPKLRCTELDEIGNVVLASGEFKKSELIAKVYEPMQKRVSVRVLTFVYSMDSYHEIYERLTRVSSPTSSFGPQQSSSIYSTSEFSLSLIEC